MTSRATCLLHSGGIDSTAALTRFLARRSRVVLLFVNYGQVSAPAELVHSRKVAEAFGIQPPVTLEVPGIGEMMRCSGLISGLPAREQTYEHNVANEHFPGRNLMLLALAAMYAASISARRVAIGIVGKVGARGYPDTTPGFASRADELLGQSAGIELLAPFIGWDKAQVVRYLRRSGVDLDLTYSCNLSASAPCGSCASCVERDLALGTGHAGSTGRRK